MKVNVVIFSLLHCLDRICLLLSWM